MVYIELSDFILVFFYLLLLFFISYRIARKRVAPPLLKTFLMALFLRMLGSIIFAMVHQYYYGYGDTFGYYRGGLFFTEKISEDISNIRYLFAPIEEVAQWYRTSPGTDELFGDYFAQPTGNMVMRISAILSYLSFNRYIIIGMLFAYFSFWGQWKLFEVFQHLSFKKYSKVLAFFVLYTPALWFWGSGLLKDSLCLGGIGFIVFFLYKFFVKKSVSFFELGITLFLIYMVYSIKSYIVLILATAALLTLLVMAINNIKNFVVRLSVFGLTLITAIFIISLIDFKPIIESLVKESVSVINSSIQSYEASQLENSKGGFTIPEIDPSVGGVLSSAPGAVFRALYRPFLWESGTVMILLTSLETTLILAFSVFLLFKTRVVGFFAMIFSNPFYFFCITTSILFALVIGFTTFNFGSLVRYKILLLPFFYFLHADIYSRVSGKAGAAR